ncbi:MAG: 1-deoxy-D-xylulose-5-phosphate reductoisomerase [Phycisphaerales bacterium]|nr:1-deoxy-D-xylulose-5-phosphate reductoisomerase [Phycisphaerae bacterium]NNM24524.1 1-deoxy-D-xylulose-5-phosphate reductoisomerase [Phycisphaerales bacterium]
MSQSPRRVLVLGSTGSIGTNTLAVIEHLHRANLGRFEVAGLAAGRQGELLGRQAATWGPSHVALADTDADASSMPAEVTVLRGPDAACEMIEAAARPGDLVVAAMVGAAGIPAVLAAIERGCDIALANKETLVAAGALVMPRIQTRGVRLIPVDSEHSAIAQCLRSGRGPEEIRRLVLTASGGPFRTWSATRLRSATVAEALDHPTWKMGEKVTIDSASLMNKALEVIEAHWLFGLEADRIDVVVHPPSIVHSFVEFVDGSVLAQLGPPDMRTPIQYALTWPARVDGCSRRLDFSRLSSLEFEPVDETRFPAPALAREVIRAGGTAGAIFNRANEIAVEAFLAGRLPFSEIPSLVAATLERVPATPVSDLADVLAAGEAAARVASERLGAPTPSTACLADRESASHPLK